jgi:hypothetical protein
MAEENASRHGTENPHHEEPGQERPACDGEVALDGAGAAVHTTKPTAYTISLEIQGQGRGRDRVSGLGPWIAAALKQWCLKEERRPNFSSRAGGE